MPWSFIIPIAASVIGGAISSGAQSDAASTAAGAQTQASAAQIAESQRQFNSIRDLLKPYADAGIGAIGAQQNLIGLNGNSAQGSAIQGIANSPEFTGMIQQGENGILANASATGGLRGGNVQGALANFRPQLLAQLINQQYSRLGGLTSIGQNAAAGTGNAVFSTGNQINNSLGQIGQAQAGNALAQGRALAGFGNTLGGGLGLYSGLGGFGGTSEVPMVEQQVNAPPSQELGF